MSLFEDFLLPHNLDEDGEFMPLLSLDEDESLHTNESFPEVLPILALKNTVLFPGIVIPITVGRDKSIKAIYKAYKEDRIIAVLSQKDQRIEDPKPTDLYQIGTVARILKLLKMPDGTATAIIQGRKRITVQEFVSDEPYLSGKTKVLDETAAEEDDLEYKALISSIKDMAKEVIQLSPNIPSEAVVMLKNITNSGFLINFISSNLGIKVSAKQVVLEINDPGEKAKSILEHMDNELQLLELKYKIESKVRGDIEKQQRDYFLNQQLKTIQEELGQNPQEEEIKVLVERAKKKIWPKEIGDVFKREVAKIKRINPQVAEYSVQMNYLDLLVELPWNEYTTDNFDLKKVKKVLDKDHFGLEDVKERILEHLAVLKLKGDMKAPILCLVGPPGVGKTSLGRSIANALKRKFIRMSLGGLHDESEIRGHRKTYIGAMPGRIIQNLKKIKSANPVFILDEIDKVGKDFRGDPSSALLEVLDPEQNSTFHDNYLDVEFDLSKVLFIATANSL
ncbi:MAG: ATP-dependent Lon protease, partial [Saprospiraceae bacterium]